jgi:hypothetical protein
LLAKVAALTRISSWKPVSTTPEIVFGGDVPRMSFAGEWQSEDDTALSMIQGVFHFSTTGVSFISASAAFFHDPARAFFEGFSEPGRGLWLAAGAEGAVKDWVDSGPSGEVEDDEVPDGRNAKQEVGSADSNTAGDLRGVPSRRLFGGLFDSVVVEKDPSRQLR